MCYTVFIRGDNMRAATLVGKRKFEINEIEEPTSKNGEVLIHVLKSGICGSDLHYFETGEPKGLVLGHEFCGTIIDPGDRTDLKEGDVVTALPISPCGHCSACTSGNPQYCKETWKDAVGLSMTHPGGLTSKISVRGDMVYKVPDNVRPEEMAMVEPTAVALHGVHLADIKLGQKVLVIGGGIIGLMSAMLAKKEGASFVAVSETNPNRGKKALALGVADKYYDATKEDMIMEVMQDTGSGFDVVIECCGNAPAVTSSLLMVKPGGTVTLVGVATGPISIPTVIAVMNELTVKGAIAYTKDEFETCIQMIASKQIEVMKFVDDMIPLSKVQEAYERLTSGTDDAVKILVDPNQ